MNRASIHRPVHVALPGYNHVGVVHVALPTLLAAIWEFVVQRIEIRAPPPMGQNAAMKAKTASGEPVVLVIVSSTGNAALQKVKPAVVLAESHRNASVVASRHASTINGCSRRANFRAPVRIFPFRVLARLAQDHHSVQMDSPHIVMGVGTRAVSMADGPLPVAILLLFALRFQFKERVSLVLGRHLETDDIPWQVQFF